MQDRQQFWRQAQGFAVLAHESLDVGEVVIFGTRDSRLMLLRTGDLITMSCELEQEQVCVGKSGWESCVDLFMLEECVFLEIVQ